MVLASDTTVTIQYNVSDGANCPAGINCLQQGARAADKWYAIWLVKGSSGVGVILTSEDDTFSAPTGYTDSKKRLGWIETNGSSNIHSFVARPGYDFSRVFSCDESTSFVVSSTSTTNVEDLSSVIPPNIKWASIWGYVAMDNSSGDATRTLHIGNGSRLGVIAWELVIYGGSTSTNIPSQTTFFETEIYDTGAGTARRVNTWQTGSASTREIGCNSWTDDLL